MSEESGENGESKIPVVLEKMVDNPPLFKLHSISDFNYDFSKYTGFTPNTAPTLDEIELDAEGYYGCPSI